MSIWIESHVELSEHPKVYVLTETLGVRRAETIGLLHMLWHFTMKFAWRDGDLEKFDDIAIARASGWELEPKKFIEALQFSKFLDGKKVHDWQSFAGKLIRDRLYKESTRVLPESPGVAKSTPKAVTKPLPSQYNKDKDICTLFDKFWTSYPRKTAKHKAREEWNKIKDIEAIFEAIQGAVYVQKNTKQWQEGFIPHASTWLHQKRWEDEIFIDTNKLEDQDTWKTNNAKFREELEAKRRMDSTKPSQKTEPIGSNTI